MHGEFVSYHGVVDVAGAPTPQLMLAALGPQMLRVCGARTAGTTTAIETVTQEPPQSRKPGRFNVSMWAGLMSLSAGRARNVCHCPDGSVSRRRHLLGTVRSRADRLDRCSGPRRHPYVDCRRNRHEQCCFRFDRASSDHRRPAVLDDHRRARGAPPRRPARRGVDLRAPVAGTGALAAVLYVAAGCR